MRTAILVRVLCLALLLCGLGPTSALAKGGDKALPEIQETGISAFDDVFGSIGAIHETLAKAQNRIIAAQDKVALAIGQPAGTPIRMSMWELKQKSGGKIAVKMKGTKPQVTMGGGGGSEITRTVKATNDAVGEIVRVIGDLQKLPAQVMELVNACKAFPSQISSAVKEAGLAPTALPRVVKSVTTNVKATVATPARIVSLLDTSKDFLTGIPQGIAATEPPVDPVGKKNKNKKAKKEKVAKAQSPNTGKASRPSRKGDEPPDSDAMRLISSSMVAYEDAEVDVALSLIHDAETELIQRTDPVSPVELQHLFQYKALILHTQGNAAEAMGAVIRALCVEPGVPPLRELGSEYAKLHKSVAKAGAIHTITVHVQGDGEAIISGKQTSSGPAQVPRGVHLLQVPDGEHWKTEWRELVPDAMILL